MESSLGSEDVEFDIEQIYAFLASEGVCDGPVERHRSAAFRESMLARRTLEEYTEMRRLHEQLKEVYED
jgi:predicted deacylase